MFHFTDMLQSITNWNVWRDIKRSGNTEIVRHETSLLTQYKTDQPDHVAVREGSTEVT